MSSTREVPTQMFQGLNLSGIHSSQFRYISQFLSRVLNVPQEHILAANRPPAASNDDTEILPDIHMPSDLWLRSAIAIHDVKIKISMLAEVNSMLSRELRQLDFDLDDNMLTYYQKLFVAYRFYEPPTKNVALRPSIPDLALREEDEDEELGSPVLNRTISSQSSVSNGLASTSRRSSRDTISRRLASLVGMHDNEANHNAANGDDETKKPLTSILAKSRIYSKIKKHREASSSFASNTSAPYSNRNSVETISTTSSLARRNSSAPLELDRTEPAFVQMTQLQKQENQKNKSDYYVQVRNLLVYVDRIQHVLQAMPRHNKAFKLIDFVKRYLFKFIVLDVMHMIMAYGEIEAYNLYNINV